MSERDVYERYANLIASLLPPGGPTFHPVAEDGDAVVQVERGLVLPMAIAGADADRIATVTDRLLNETSASSRIVDASGHSRPAYPGLLVYAWRRAMEVVGERHGGNPFDANSPALRAWRRRISGAIQRTREMTWDRAIAGTDILGASVDTAWSELAIRSRHARFTAGVIGEQESNGSFLPTNPSFNPEPFWYHELVLLHAIAARGVNDPTAADAASKNAAYHLYETQPDHATNEPWGLLAFIRSAQARPVADQMLHTVRVQHPAGATGVTAILLADVLIDLRELARRSG